MNKTGFVAILETSESSMELRTRLKPHSLRSDDSEEEQWGFLGGISSVCAALEFPSAGERSMVGHHVGFSCPAPYTTSPSWTKRGCSPSSNRTFISMRKGGKKGKEMSPLQPQDTTEVSDFCHTRLGRAFVMQPCSIHVCCPAEKEGSRTAGAEAQALS